MRFRSVLMIGILYVPLSLLHADPNSIPSLENWSQILHGSVESISEYAGSDEASLILKRTLAFNADNQLLTEKTYGKDGQITVEAHFSYSENKVLAEINGIASDGSLKWQYQYQYKNRLIQDEASYDGSGTLEWHDVYRYGDDGLLQEKTNFNASGAVNLQTTYQYDDKKRITTRTALYADGKLLKRVLIFYNEAGRVSREERYDPNGLYEQVAYQYNEGELLSEVKTTALDGSAKELIRKEYDANGNLSQESSIRPDNPMPSTTVYAYDEQGNLIRKQTSNKIIIKRTIVYRK